MFRSKLKWTSSQGTAVDTNMVDVGVFGDQRESPRHLRSLSNLQHVGKDGSTPARASGKGKESGYREDQPKGHWSQQPEQGSGKEAKCHLLRSVFPEAKQKIGGERTGLSGPEQTWYVGMGL